MMQQREPSPQSPDPSRDDADTAPRVAAPAEPVAPVTPPPAARPKGPPQDPEAFQRWIGIERLKVDMRRLELETKRLETPPPAVPQPAPGRPVLPILYGLLLVAALGLSAFLAAQTMGLRQEVATLKDEVATLRTAQAEIGQRLSAAESEQIGLREAVEAAQTQANAPQPAPAVPPPEPAASTTAAPADAATQPSPEAAAAPNPALPGAGYTVRIFAPVNTVPKARIDSFINPLKAAGYDVVVSDTGVVQTTSNSLSFHASSEEMAKRLSMLIQQKKPAIAIEMRASPSIPASARQILILNLTEDTFN